MSRPILAIDVGTGSCKAAYLGEEAVEPVVLPLADGSICFPSVAEVRDRRVIDVGARVVRRFAAGDLEEEAFAYRAKANLSRPADSFHGLSCAEILAAILRGVRRAAEASVGLRIQRAVLVHPAYFDVGTLVRLSEAAASADLEIDQAVPDPLAGAVGLQMSRRGDDCRAMLYDHGAGALHVAIVEKQGGSLRIQGIDGDVHLGGEELDRILADRIWEGIADCGFEVCHHAPIRCSACQRYVHRLAWLLEPVKARLSVVDRTPVIVTKAHRILDHAGRSVTVERELTRREYEEWILPVVKRAIVLCRRAAGQTFRSGAIGGSDRAASEEEPLGYWRQVGALGELYLLGGSCRTPLIQQRLEAEWGSAPSWTDDLGTAARGAALIAGEARSAEA